MKNIIRFLWFFCSFLVCLAEAEEPFIMGHLVGQLGNQLFQIAATVSLALDNNVRPVFPDLCNKSEFNIPINYKYVLKKLDVLTPTAPITFEYKEACFHFEQIPYTPNMSLLGHFQSEKYFEHHKDTILKLFSPSEEIKSYLIEKYNQIIEHPKTVSIHIRMYKDSSPNYHPFVGWKYINKAIQQFDPSSLFVVFSDDIALCEKKLKRILKNNNIVFIKNNQPSHIYDLYLMSMCKSHIISNSSFSWWGAYLDKNPDKIVIAPSKWFGESYAHYNTKDLLPKGWKML